MKKLMILSLSLLGLASAASSVVLPQPTRFTTGEFLVQLSLEPNAGGDKVKGVGAIHYAYSRTAAAGTYLMVLTEPLSSPNRFGLRRQSGERTRKVLLEKSGKLMFHLKKGVKVQDAVIKTKLVPDGGKVCLTLTLEVDSPTLERLTPTTPFTVCQ